MMKDFIFGTAYFEEFTQEGRLAKEFRLMRQPQRTELPAVFLRRYADAALPPGRSGRSDRSDYMLWQGLSLRPRGAVVLREG